MQRTDRGPREIGAWLAFAVALAAAAPSAFAVDPVLHNLPVLLPEEATPGAPLLVMPQPAPARDAAGVEVREIKELGARSRADQDTVAEPEDLWQRIREGFAMPDLDNPRLNPLVARHQARYAGNPAQLKTVVERSRRYLFHIVEELERRGMPTELALLPMVESAFNPMAYSRAHASGLWQFIPSTGRNYNLEQNWWFDARRDIVASTNAALDYLSDLHEMYGDWHLALAAYNYGENGLARAIERNRARGKPTDLGSLPLPKETQNYVPQLQALKNIVAAPERFGVALDPIPNAPYFVTVALTRDIDLQVAAQLAGMPVDELISLNPGHNRPVVSTSVAPSLVLPADRAEAFLRSLAQSSEPLSSWQTYAFQNGDRLDKLALSHGISETRLRQINGIGPRHRVAPGETLLLPIGTARVPSADLPLFRLPSYASTGRTITYRVKRGDTLSTIARHHHVSVDDLRRWNDIHGVLRAGQRLTIEVRGTATADKPTRHGTPGAVKPAKTPPAAPTQVARPSSSS
ncbi:MAG: transglycosylase SLT domain-containing protein [Burkholderiales bacterium]|nr:transglycosylase SLT domain-containing protein [Burkholderiales bacterium]